MFNETLLDIKSTSETDTNKNGKLLLISAAQRVWLELYLTKKSFIEDCLKVNLNSIGRNPTLDQFRSLLTEPANKVWTSFIEGEKKLPEKIQSHLQAKLQRVTGGISTMAGGLSRVVSLKKQKKEIIRLSLKDLNETASSIGFNLVYLRDFVDYEYRKHFRCNEQRHLFLYGEWLKIEKDLLRERALWGADEENSLNKWKLDFTEGPNRRRKRLLTNTDDFYRLYPYRPELDTVKASKKYKIPSSFDSKEYFQGFRVNSLLHYHNKQRVESFQATTPLNVSMDSSQSDAQSQPFTLDAAVVAKGIKSLKKLSKDSQSENNSVFASICEEKSQSLNETSSVDGYAGDTVVLSPSSFDSTTQTNNSSSYSRQNTQLNSSMNSNYNG